MQINLEQKGDVQVLRLNGQLSYPEGTAMLRQMSRELTDNGQRALVIDMLDVPWLDSSGIGEVVACYKRARQYEGTVKLVLEKQPYAVFTYCHLQRMFEIFGDLDAAVASFRR